MSDIVKRLRSLGGWRDGHGHDWYEAETYFSHSGGSVSLSAARSFYNKARSLVKDAAAHIEALEARDSWNRCGYTKIEGVVYHLSNFGKGSKLVGEHLIPDDLVPYVLRVLQVPNPPEIGEWPVKQHESRTITAMLGVEWNLETVYFLSPTKAD